MAGDIISGAYGIVVERDNIILNGAGYTFQGTGSGTGISLAGRTNATVQDTTIKAFNDGIVLYSSSNNSIAGNSITANNQYGVYLDYSSNNSNIGDNITNNGGGLLLESSSSNSIYYNNFENNTVQAIIPMTASNTWDNGYPSGGNYWSGYTGADVKKGPNQDEPGSDDLGDIPYVLDENNRDNYPLIYAYGSLPPLLTH